MQKITGREVVTGREVGLQVCEALGIDANRVRSLTLHIVPNDAVTVMVERFVSMGSIQSAMPELVNEKYELVQRESCVAKTP